MKISIVTIFLALTTVDAFAPARMFTRTPNTLLGASITSPNDQELSDAIAEVRAAAKEFSGETEHFANVWIDRVLSGEQEGVASGLLEECVIDDGTEKCQRFEQALKRLDTLLGVGAGEQY